MVSGYIPYEPITNSIKGKSSYVNIIVKIWKSAFGSFTELEDILRFVVMIVELFGGIMNFYRNMGSDTGSFKSVEIAVERLFSQLIAGFKAGGHGFQLPHRANEVLQKYMKEKLRKTQTDAYPQLHREFYNEFYFEAMKVHESCKTLLVLSGFIGKETDELSYMCKIHREIKGKELWEITITGKSIVVKKGGKEPSDEDLKISMTSLLELMSSEATFDNFESIVRVGELYVLLTIYMVYKDYEQLTYLKTSLIELRKIYSVIEQTIGIPVCIAKLASLAEKFLNKDSNKFRLKLQGDKIVEDCRKPLFFFLNKCERYLGLIVFFRCHKPTMLKSTGVDESVQFSLEMNCICPNQTEGWQVTMSSEKLPLKFDFNPSRASRFAKCWKGNMSLFRSLRKFYSKRLEGEAPLAIDFYNFLSYVKLILISLIWQMSEATQQQEVDDLIKEFQNIIIFLNKIICTYDKTTMTSDAFKHVVDGATRFYSQNFNSTQVAASKSDIKWTNMAVELYDDLTVQGPSDMDTQTYMEEKGVFIHVDDNNGGLKFTFKDGDTFYEVQFTANKHTGKITFSKSSHEAKIVALLTNKSAVMKVTQLMTSIIFLNLYGTPAMKELSAGIVEKLVNFGPKWKDAGTELASVMSDTTLLNYRTVVTFISRYNLTLKADTVADSNSSENYLSTLNISSQTGTVVRLNNVVESKPEGGNENSDNPNNQETVEQVMKISEPATINSGGNDDGGHEDGGIEDGGNEDGTNEYGGHEDGGNINCGNDDGGHEDGTNEYGGHEDGGNINCGNDDGGNKDDEDGEDSSDEEPKQAEFKKSQLKSIKNMFKYDDNRIILSWTVVLAYEDQVRRIIFKRNDQGDWVAMDASMSKDLSEEEIETIYEEIISYCEKAKTLDIDPLRELLLAATIIILILNQITSEMHTHKKIEGQISKSIEESSKHLHHEGNYLHRVAKCLHENHKIQHLIHKIERIDFKQTAEEIVCGIIIILSEANVKDVAFNWSSGTESLELGFKMGTQYMQLHSVKINSNSHHCDDHQPDHNIDRCLNSILKLVSLNEEQPMDSLKRAFTVLFYIYKSSQCNLDIGMRHREKLCDTILLNLGQCCSILFKSMIPVYQRKYVEKICSLFTYISSDVKFETLLAQVLKYASDKFSIVQELVTMLFGMQVIYMVRGPTLKQSSFYLDESLTLKLDSNLLKGTLLNNYLKYIESTDEFDIKNCMSSMIFLLSYAQYLVGIGQDASFMSVMLTTIFSKMESRFADSAAEIKQIKDWVTKILGDILGGSYTSQDVREFYGKIILQTEELSKAIITTRVTISVNHEVEALKRGYLYQFSHIKTEYKLSLIDGEPIVTTENEIVMRASRMRIVLREVLKFAYDITKKIVFAQLLIFLVCLMRAILEEEGQKIDEEAWAAFLKELIGTYGGVLSGNEEFIGYMKLIFFGKMVQTVSLFMEAAEKQDQAIRARKTAKTGRLASGKAYGLAIMGRGEDISYSWTREGEKITVSKQIGFGDERDLDTESIKLEVNTLISKINDNGILNTSLLRILLENIVKFVMVLLLRIKEDEKAVVVESFIKQLKKILTEKSWMGSNKELLQNTVAALEKLPSAKICDIFEKASELVRGK
ncbi:hypothetical protein Ciccas_011461 [Cichlidogyrus casuarinus]|uniref:Uncharacterized protein n=1 Tax=Cichlidogyrus casuarinus TaxID=1844966 RepID=A0ABD2PR72_9PLAT